MKVFLISCLLACAMCATMAPGASVREVRLARHRLSPRPLPLGVPRHDTDSVIDGQIVGGRDAQENEFPYQISMQVSLSSSFWINSGPQHICGGTLVATNWVLTAAHCVYGVPTTTLKVEVVAGIVNLDVRASGSQRVTVAKMLVHSKYDHYRDGGVGPYDIAMLKLARDVTLSESVQLAALPEADSEPTGDALLSGWGSTSQDGYHPVYPSQLQAATLPVMARDDCLQFFEDDEKSLLATTNLCAGSKDQAGLSSCSGDSGGPLAQRGADGTSVVIGVVSWGLTDCGSKPFPSVFTRVSAYNGWIQSVITRH